ncbi:CorA family divalent cation transporter [Aliikangiella sp. IMCC44653]
MSEINFDHVLHEDGLVCAYLLGQEKHQSLTWAEVNAWDKSQGPIWIHLDLTEEKSEHWLLNESGIAPEIVSSLLRNDTRPRFSEIDNEQVLLIIRAINFHQGFAKEDMLSLRVWTDGVRLVSVRRKPLLAVIALRKAVEQGDQIKNIDQLLLFLIRHIDAKIEPVIYELSQHLDDVEDTMEATGSYAKEDLANVKLTASTFLRHLSPQRDVLSRMRESNIVWLKNYRNSWRELFHGLVIYVDELTDMKEKVNFHQELENQRVLQQTNQTMYLLSIIAAIFLPLTLLTGMLGINVGGIPGTNHPWAFAIVCVGTLVLGIFEVIYFKKKKWL